MPELKHFEDDLFSLISNIKFRHVKNQLQDMLRADKSKIQQTDKVIIQADKSPNLYMMSVQDYKKKVKEVVTKDYKKTAWNELNKVTTEAATIAKKLDLAERIDIQTEDECFITVKDHKESFPGKVECRLINPAKNNIGSISKAILDRINKTIRTATKSNQWQNTNSAINWFISIPNKPSHTFLKFDIVSFYPSIKKQLLMDAISWARTITDISDDEVKVILHCRKTFLFHENECWVKKTDQNFDVSMGSLDSAEVTDLVGLFLLSLIEQLIPQSKVGLYRDDGLAVVDLPGPEVERLRKRIVKLFSDHHLQITTESNIQSTDFLDVLFNLHSSSYKPFRKDTSPPTYVHLQSNHPPHVKRDLPRMIGKRLSCLSSNQMIFNNESHLYNHALKSAGYREEVKFEENATKRTEQRRRRRRVIWFNPPWSQSVETNVAKKFLALVDKHFPKGSDLNQHFNRNTIKVSYSTMPNMTNIISSHNRKLTSRAAQPSEEGCNCRRPNECALQGKCQTSNLVYRCRVTIADDTQDYIGLTSTTFKQRYTNHKASFVHANKAHSTSLSSFIWELKNQNQAHSLDWSIVGLAPSYGRKVRMCHLCLLEKTSISLADPKKTLNKRNEIISKCRHRDKMLLKHW